VVYDSFVLDKRDDYVAYASYKLGSLDDAREVVNEAFFKLYLRWDEALASENTAAYGWKILHDGVVDMLRKRERRPDGRVDHAVANHLKPTSSPNLGGLCLGTGGNFALSR
jgi:DNA-directed RNA polymerase specialized sigma24 family protein